MTGYISVKTILDDLLEHPLLQDLSLERAINHTVHFIRILGCTDALSEKTAVINIENYRGLLPCDFNTMIQVRMSKTGDNRVFRYSTDSFHMSDKKSKIEDLVYKTQGNVIFTSIKEGNIEIAYRAIAVDSEGYPLIPDDSNFIRALELYIKKHQFTILFDLGKIQPAVYNNVCQEYGWAVAMAHSSLKTPTIDQMQSITNSWNTFVQRTHEHEAGFSNNGSREQYKRH